MERVVKDAADDPDCQGLGEQWYYLRFYMRRTMPPNAYSSVTGVTLVKLPYAQESRQQDPMTLWSI